MKTKFKIAISQPPNHLYPTGTIWKLLGDNTARVIAPPNHKRIGLANKGRHDKAWAKVVEV